MTRYTSCGAPRAVFVSDLHLGTTETPRHRAFTEYLGWLERLESPPALYILGDLFHYWVGPASIELPGHKSILEAIGRVSRAGIDVSFVNGNRDFLIDETIGTRCGMRVRSTNLTLRLGRYRVLALHGDTLLLADKMHLRARWFLRSFWFRFLSRWVTAGLARRVGARIRGASVRRTERQSSHVYDVPASAAARLFRGGFDVIVCGHVHDAARRLLEVDGEQRVFYTLGAWEDEASILEFDGEDFRFASFAIGDGDD